MTPAQRRLLLLGAALPLAAVTACGGATGSDARPTVNPGGVMISSVHQDSRFLGDEPAEPYRMPDITLTADNGQPFNLVTDTAYPVTLVFFGYTSCPDTCPLVMSDMAAAIRLLPSAVRARTQLLFVTVDPARDTPSVLRRYLDRYDRDFVGLTGSLAHIKAAGSALGVPVTGTKKLPGGGYEVGHGSQVLGFRGNIAPVLWTPHTPVADIAADITRLAGV